MDEALGELIALLRCPATGAELRPDGDGLVAAGDDGRRYGVHAGFPVLLTGAEDGGAPREAAGIRAAFRRRAPSYFADNYEGDANPGRRHRLQLVVSAIRAAAAPGATVLDAGSGPAVLAEAVRALRLGYVALDLSLDNLLAARRRAGDVTGVVGSVTALPFADGSFDGAVAMGCLEYVAPVDVALAELSRVVRPGGFVLATFANRRSPGRLWEEAVLHPLVRVKQRLAGGGDAIYRRRLHDPAEIARTLEANGCRVVAVEHFGPGLLGHPLSAVGVLRRVDERSFGRFGWARSRAAEFLVRAERR